MMKYCRYALSWMSVFIGLYLCSLYNYLLFHSIAEIFSIIIAFVIFTIVWNARDILKNNYFIFLGIAFLFIGCIDLLHTLSYKGMTIFEGYGTNLPTQLWIAARYMQSLSFLIAPYFLRKNIDIKIVMIGYLTFFSLLVMSIFFWEIFPVCYIEGSGLTTFKKASEYVISLFLLSSIPILYTNRDKFDRLILQWIIWSIILTIVSELALTFYMDVYGLSNLIGHCLKILAFWFIYKGLIESGLKRPYGLLFRELKQSEERYHSLFSNMLNGLAYHKVLLDEKGNPVDYVFLDANDAFERLTGIKKKGLIGKKATDVIPGIEKDPADWINIYGKVASTGEPIHIEQYSIPLGRWYNVHAYSTEKGYFFTLFEDVTDRRTIQDAIKKSKEELDLKVKEQTAELSRTNELLQAIINNIPVIIFICDSMYKIKFINKEFENHTGWLLNETEGTDCMKLCHPDPSIYKEMWDYIIDTSPGWQDFPLRTRDGRDLEISWASVRLTDGSIIGIGIDVTRRKAVKKKLAENIEQLERSNRELQEFAFMASHDLQEPLRKIRTFGDLLVAKYGSAVNETGIDYIERMQKASTRMQRLIDSLLSYSRVSTKAGLFSKVDLNKKVKEALANLEIRISETNASVEVDKLPVIEADRDQMIQLFQNLIGNALKFSSKDDIPRIKIYAKKFYKGPSKRSPEYEIHVEDNGIGFDEKYADRIFYPFQRLHGRDQYEGGGMGLAICNKIVQRHKGSIRVKSTLNKGSIFIVTLPEKQA